MKDAVTKLGGAYWPGHTCTSLELGPDMRQSTAAQKVKILFYPMLDSCVVENFLGSVCIEHLNIPALNIYISLSFIDIKILQNITNFIDKY